MLTAGAQGVTSDSILDAAGLSPDEAGPEAATAMVRQVRRKAGMLGPTGRAHGAEVVYCDDADDGADSSDR